MNIILIEANTTHAPLQPIPNSPIPSNQLWQIDDPRQIRHIQQVLGAKVGDTLRVGIRNQARYLTQIIAIQSDAIQVQPIEIESVPPKIPVTLIVALPRPKVLRRLVMDSVSLGIEKLVLIHSYRVDKSYWQSPFLQQLQHYSDLGLEQAGDVFSPTIECYQRFRPFVEDHLAQWTQQRPTFVGHPYAGTSLPQPFNQPCQLVVGCEGGFIPFELQLLQQNGAQLVQCGSRILRTETAIAVLLARLFSV